MENDLNILNFIVDDKFLDIVMDNHDLVRDHVKHYYVLVINDDDDKEGFHFKYIKKKDRVILLHKNDIIDFIKNNFINAIILHSLYSAPVDIIPHIDSKIPILWIAWGYDIYQYPYRRPLIPLNNLYLPQTDFWLSKLEERGKGMKSLIKDKFLLLKRFIYETKQMKQVIRAVSRINFFSGILDLEYDLMNHNTYFSARKAAYSYGPFVLESSLSHPTGNNILVGNSGNPTNNHIDILKLLQKRGISSVDIIAPMNYGGEKQYTSLVKKLGKDLFGEKFIPLITFLERSDYIKFISSCSSVVIGTIRQQAVGNISLAFENGAKIFFYKDSILYKYYKSCGFIVFSIEEDLSVDSVLTPLSKEEAKYNFTLYHILYTKRWNTDAIKKLYSQFRDFQNFNK